MKKYKRPECNYCDKKGDKPTDIYYKYERDIRGNEGTFIHLECFGKFLKSIGR